MKNSKPGEMFNKFKAKKKKGLRPARAVVKGEQNASHQFYKKGTKKKKKPMCKKHKKVMCKMC